MCPWYFLVNALRQPALGCVHRASSLRWATPDPQRSLKARPNDHRFWPSVFWCWIWDLGVLVSKIGCAFTTLSSFWDVQTDTEVVCSWVGDGYFGIMFTTLAPSCPFLKLLIPTIQRNAPSQRSTDLESPDCTAIGSGCTHVFERLLAGYEHFSPLTESIFFTTCMQRENHLCS